MRGFKKKRENEFVIQTNDDQVFFTDVILKKILLVR